MTTTKYQALLARRARLEALLEGGTYGTGDDHLGDNTLSQVERELDTVHAEIQALERGMPQ